MQYRKKIFAVGALGGWAVSGLVQSVSREFDTVWPYSIATAALIAVVAYVATRPANDSADPEETP